MSAVAWDGKGLPPVGVICMIDEQSGRQGLECDILYVSKTHAIYRWIGGDTETHRNTRGLRFYEKPKREPKPGEVWLSGDSPMVCVRHDWCFTALSGEWHGVLPTAVYAAPSVKAWVARNLLDGEQKRATISTENALKVIRRLLAAAQLEDDNNE